MDLLDSDARRIVQTDHLNTLLDSADRSGARSRLRRRVGYLLLSAGNRLVREDPCRRAQRPRIA